MYELDSRKDQVMTVCKVALAMWVRDRYFPPLMCRPPGNASCRFFSFLAPSPRTPRWCRSNCVCSTTVRSIET